MISKLNNLPNKYLFYFGLFFVLIFISLSYWQYTSYLEEKELSAQILYPENPTEVIISQINTSNEFSLITTQEKLQTVKTWLLRSRVNNGVSGYHVITIYRNDMNEHMLINRGWVPLSADVDNYNSVLKSHLLECCIHTMKYQDSVRTTYLDLNIYSESIKHFYRMKLK